jgi:uncharacterized lipoprotein YddW (UPF0748 family)
VNRRIIIGIATVALVIAAMPGAATADEPMEEFRAFWVDAFGAGIYTEAEVDDLIAAAQEANMNALVVQVGRRGDCFCNNAVMPRTQFLTGDPSYDPLQTLIDKAHAVGIEVHAWVIATAIWQGTTPPLAPDHVYNTHGPATTGYDNWVMTRYDGSRPGDTYLDPGHPDAADYIVSMFTSIVANYDVDGINFDRIRYPDGQLGGWPLDSSWGYNAVALDRFHAATGRTDLPEPDDAQWSQWRRDQITNIVRRVYLEAHAIDPDIVVSADTITYSDAPPYHGDGTWEATRPYRETLQDWRAWMEEGILDLNIPMNYKREWCFGDPIPTDPPGCFNLDQRALYENWNEFIKDHQYDRQAAIGAGVYLNYVDGSVDQVRKARVPSAAGNTAIGWVGYSYRTPDLLANLGQRPGPVSRVELIRALTEPSEYDEQTPPVFAEPATVPPRPWLESPTVGHVYGRVVDAAGAAFDQVRVDLHDAETDAFVGSLLTDGSGHFGFVDLAPGRYKASVDGERVHGRRVATVVVSAGDVAQLQLTVKPR